MKNTDIAIVLHKQEYSESSLIVQLFTRQNGVQSFIFKGAKRKGSNLFPLCIAEITYYSRRESELLNLTDFQPIQNWSYPFNPIRSSIAFYCCELLHQCVREEVEDRDMYQYIEHTVQQIEHDKIDGVFPLIFTVNLAKILGFGPLIENNSAQYIDLVQGAFIMSRPYENRGHVLDGEPIELIKQICLGETVYIADKRVRIEALKIFLKYYRIHIPGFKDLKSLPILETLLND